MKPQKKRVSFQLGVDSCPPPVANASYEKRYFQSMLSRLQQQRPATSPAATKIPTPMQNGHVANGDALTQRPKRRSSSAVFDRRNRAKRAVAPVETTPPSLARGFCSFTGLEIVGVKPSMTSRSPSPMTPTTMPSLQSTLPRKQNRVVYRSREILDKIQNELVRAKEDNSSTRRFGLNRLRSSRSLTEISNLVMELDNNLAFGSVVSENGADEELPIYRNKTPDVCDTILPPSRPFMEVSANSLMYSSANSPLIGRGCFANVYKGTFFGTAVAIKEFKATDDGDEPEGKRSRRCLQEATQLARIRHPNVAGLIAVCTEKNALALELVDGASLGTRIGYMVDDDILSISRDVLLALNYLHNLTPEATVHLDIKPTNILVHGIRSSAKICDFGSARSLSPATDKIFLGGVSGTPAWMAPEVVERRPVGRPADVYSFGVVLWQMLSGEMPYNGFGLGQVCKAICQGKHPMLKQEFDDRLPGIIDLARSCWEFEADKRPNCCRLLVELDVVKENMALRSIPTPPPPPPMPHPQRPQERVPAFGSPERPRQAPPAGYGFSVTSDDLEVQRSRLKTPKQLVDKETSTNGLAQVMQKVIVERRESWRDSSGGEEEQCSSPWSPTEEEEISVSLRGQ